MIDLRSDTVTMPTEAMLRAMMEAKVGDDVYGEDPSVNELQDYTASLLGKEAALFVPSGTMGNQICIAVNTQPGDEIIAEADAHIFYYETAAPSVISRVQVRTIPSAKGMMDLDKVEDAVRTSEYYFPRTSLVCVENTHNRHGGAIISLNYIKELKQLVDDHGLLFHCDGARLWNASAATGISMKEFAVPFDTISVCLSKGLGAPVGSVIAGSAQMIEKARKWRKILGGGMRQAGLLASAGLYAIKENFALLKYDHEHARQFASDIAVNPKIDIDVTSVETNMVFFKLPVEIKTDSFLLFCRNNGLLIGMAGKRTVRAVFHIQVNAQQAREAAEIILEAVDRLT